MKKWMRNYKRAAYRKHRLCPIPGCKCKPQKRLADHFRKQHPEVTTNQRRRLLKKAKVVPRNYIPPKIGQTKLEFKDTRLSGSQEIYKKSGTSRSLGRFPSSLRELQDFKTHLMGIEGKRKGENSAKAIVTDVSKFLYFANPESIDWSLVANTAKLRLYVEKVEKMGVGPEGQLTKLERISDCLKFLKCTHRDLDFKTEAQDAECRIRTWKTILRKEKQKLNAHRIEKASDADMSLNAITEVVDNQEMWTRFNRTIQQLKGGAELSDAALKTAMGSVMVATVLKSYQRPGALCNCTVAEYWEATSVDGVLVIRVKDHKTSQYHGTAKLTLDRELQERLRLYFKYVRPHLVDPEATSTSYSFCQALGRSPKSGI